MWQMDMNYDAECIYSNINVFQACKYEYGRCSQCMHTWWIIVQNDFKRISIGYPGNGGRWTRIAGEVINFVVLLTAVICIKITFCKLNLLWNSYVARHQCWCDKTAATATTTTSKTNRKRCEIILTEPNWIAIRSHAHHILGLGNKHLLVVCTNGLTKCVCVPSFCFALLNCYIFLNGRFKNIDGNGL